MIKPITLAATIAALALAAAGCGGDEGGSGGVITADGSSTVGPFVTTAAQDFKEADRSQRHRRHLRHRRRVRAVLRR